MASSQFCSRENIDKVVQSSHMHNFSLVIYLNFLPFITIFSVSGLKFYVFFKKHQWKARSFWYFSCFAQLPHLCFTLTIPLFKVGWCLELTSVKSWAVFNTSKDWVLGMHSLRTCSYWWALFHLSQMVHKILQNVCKFCVSTFQARDEFRPIIVSLNCKYIL